MDPFTPTKSDDAPALTKTKARKVNDGLYKRCPCPPRKWTKCAHPWHFDFYKGRKFRFSIAKLSGRAGFMPKADAEGLRDLYRSQIRDGSFRDPNDPAPAADLLADARLTFGDVADR